MKKRIANWGNYPVVESNEFSFSFYNELKQLIDRNESFIPRGNGRCYGDAAMAENIISCLKYDKIVSFDTGKGIFECQSGITLDQVLQVIVPKGWFLPVTPGTKFITIGGAVASDVHGKNHHVDGSFCKHVLEIELILANGESKICSAFSEAELFEASCGGMGLTGVITRVRLRLMKIETAYISQKQIKAQNLEELIRLFDEYKQYRYSVAWIDCLQKGKDFGRGIMIAGKHSGLEEIPPEKRSRPLEWHTKKSINLPFFLPSWILNTFTVKAFNFLYYGKNLKKELNSVVPFEPFFYPLDMVENWNRGYGRRGFVQYQFVIPLDAKKGLVEILNRIGAEGLGSFLTVLKVFGRQESLISFPMEGYTLALDFPVRNSLFSFLDELDKIVLQYGGRIYLSKDARMKPEILQGGYPHLERFRQIVARFNPEGKIRSLQSDRLHLIPD